MAPVLSRVTHYYKKLKIVGFVRFSRAVYHRLQKSIFIKKMRSSRRIDQIAPQLLVKPRTLPFLDHWIKHVSHDEVIEHAEQYVAGWYDLLGSGAQRLTQMPWHEDVRLRAQDPESDYEFDATTLYADISISAGNGNTIAKDIKLPWELSRFQHLPVLALAYKLTNDTRYAQHAKTQITDWLQKNSYAQGINWVCPMEVAIRATNWIIAFQWLQKSLQNDEQLYVKFVNSLREHMQYLESNWEWYDGRTSNHYLSNLVGYVYLCSFFNERNKADWGYQELLSELDWQIFDEGTSYEGSTRYHQFVTELAVHGVYIARAMGIVVEDRVLKKLDRMVMFLEWCRPSEDGAIVVIGDDDSGSLLHTKLFGLSVLLSNKRREFFGVKRYTQFGISISKASDWHVTLRHHAYNPRQPSGHFHQDAGSVTIAYKGIPIVIDPGSYLYTASRDWRNMFRSAAMHNVCYTTGHHCTEPDLFTLDLQEALWDTRSQHGGQLCTQYRLADNRCVDRSITIDDRVCVISDRVIGEGDELTTQFILDPAITVEQRAGSWFLLYQHTMLLQLSIPAHAQLSVEHTWMAPRYGCKVRTSSLHITHLQGASIVFRAVAL